MFKVGRSTEETAKLEIQCENGSRYAKIALMSPGLQKIVLCVMYYIARVCTLGFYGFKQFEPSEDQIKLRVRQIDLKNIPPVAEEPAAKQEKPELTPAQIKRSNKKKKSEAAKEKAKALNQEKEARAKAEQEKEKEARINKKSRRATEADKAKKTAAEKRQLAQMLMQAASRNSFSIG